MYSEVQFFTKLLIIGKIHVFFMIFGDKELISEFKMMLMFMYCTLLYNFLLKRTVKYIFSQNCYKMLFSWFLGSRNSFWNLELCSCLHTVQYCTVCKLCCHVQFGTVFNNNVNNRHATCLIHGFWGWGTHFWAQNDAYIHVLHSTVQMCTIHTLKYIFFSKNC